MDAKNVLTIGIDYRVVRGGVAAVENVYSTFYQPFNHETTTVNNGQVKKLLVLCEAILLFCTGPFPRESIWRFESIVYENVK